MNNPKVSICIPAYQQPELLRKALDSVLMQDYKDYEIIVTDDSPDSSVEDICKECVAKNVSLRYIKNIERKGTPENWNESMRQAKGEYIKILHHDDWFAEVGSLGKMVNLLEKNPQANLAFCGCLNFNPKDELQFVHTARIEQINRLRKDPEFLFAGNFVGAPSTTIFRNGLDVYFDSQFKWVVDLDFYMRIIRIKGLFEYTSEPLMAIRMQSDEQVTAECENDKNIQISENFNLYKKMYPDGSLMKDYVFEYFWFLFERFEIKSIEDIKNCGIDDEIPREFSVLLMAIEYHRKEEEKLVMRMLLERDAQLEAVTNSNFWKITWPIRRIFDFIKSIKNGK